MQLLGNSGVSRKELPTTFRLESADLTFLWGVAEKNLPGVRNFPRPQGSDFTFGGSSAYFLLFFLISDLLFPEGSWGPLVVVVVILSGFAKTLQAVTNPFPNLGLVSMRQDINVRLQGAGLDDHLVPRGGTHSHSGH